MSDTEFRYIVVIIFFFLMALIGFVLYLKSGKNKLWWWSWCNAL